ncbi:hypothetical protein G9A89_000813 [Geosiphon pyriformis]|nr:hypothetical protein G9A89_000813 [Geosiphon pyriformis]
MVENVLITTADGYTGYEIANQLVSNFRFKAKVKEIYATAENVNECKELEKKGVHVFQFDSSDNFNDKIKADIVVLIPPTKEDKVHRSQNLIKACESAGIKNCVLISTATTDIADPKEQPHIAHFLEIEKAAKHASFEQLVIMRYSKEQMKKGKLPIPINNGKFAPAALKDVSEAACVMLAHPEKLKEYHGKPITLTGS